jgi:hypothetical protein
MSEEPRPRGLPSIEEARRARGKLQWPSTKFWAWAGLVLAVMGIFHWKRSQGEVESARQALMAKQRAVATELGPRWMPLRDKIEGWTLAMAGAPSADLVDVDALKGWDFRDKPGIYLRMRVDEAKDVASIQKGAKDSLRDAFTACLMRVPNPNPLAGQECKRTRDCPRGEMCNELDHCALPSQPYNLRVAYRTLNVLSDAWVRDVLDATNELRVRLLAGTFDDVSRLDLPVAVDLLTRAQYFLLVLDENPADGAPAVRPDGGTVTEAVLATPHSARVGLWRLSDGKQVLRIRRDASGQLMGSAPPSDPDVADARQRQANSCALALDVRTAMSAGGAAAR